MINFSYYFRQWPTRFYRVVRHLIYPFYRKIDYRLPSGSGLIWMGDLLFYMADLMAVPEIIQSIQLLVKPSIRPLKVTELQSAQWVFKDSLDYNLIKMNDHARIGIHSKVIAYVGFNIINYKKTLPSEIFIHELMHVWQFQKFGSLYLFRAMKAQMSQTIYDFGGIENLYQKMLNGKSLLDFNFEQQAEIIETYYVSLMQPDKFSSMDKQVLAYFASFLHDSY